MDHLLARGLTCVTVLDVSGAALARAKARLGAGALRVAWIEADVTAEWPVPEVDIWHDRAVFHFLVEPADRARYLVRLNRAVKRHGTVIMATFAPDGPDRCSGDFNATYFLLPPFLTEQLPGIWRYGTWPMFLEINSEGSELGSHSRYHPHLLQLPVGDTLTQNTIHYELYHSKKMIETRTNYEKCITFATHMLNTMLCWILLQVYIMNHRE